MRIGGFKELSLNNYPGLISAVIFTSGCNLACPYCHNFHLMNSGKEVALSLTGFETWLKKRSRMLDGVVFSGGEPLLHADLKEWLLMVKQCGLKTKLDTNGTFPEALEGVISEGLVDFVAMDIKGTKEKYSLLTGCEDINFNLILRSIELVVNSGVDHEFRTTWPAELLSFEDIKKMSWYIPQQSKFYLQKFNYSEEISNPKLFSPNESLDRGVVEAFVADVKMVRGGNIELRWS